MAGRGARSAPDSRAGRGWRVSHCQNVRRGGRGGRGGRPGRAVMQPLPTLPDTWIRSRDPSGLQGALTSRLPLRTATSSISTTMPGLITSVSTPEPTSASMGSDGCVITASVKSSVTTPLLTRTSIRRGTSHGPVRSTAEDWQSMRTRSFGAGAPSIPRRRRGGPS